MAASKVVKTLVDGDSPMTSVHKRALGKALADIAKRMTPSRILNRLVSYGIMDIDDIETVNGKGGKCDQNVYICSCLNRMTDRAYTCFLLALDEEDQGFVADIIRQKEVEVEQEDIDKADSMRTRELVTQVEEPAMMLQCSRVDQLMARRLAPPPALQYREDHLPTQAACTDVAVPSNSPRLRSSDATKERQKEKERGAVRDVSSNSRTKNGCMIGVKFDLHAIRYDGEARWIEHDIKEREMIENSLWDALSLNLKNMLQTRAGDFVNHYQIVQSILELHSSGCEVKHVGHDPIQVIVQCPSSESLHQLIDMCQNNLPEKLEASVLTSALLEQTGVCELTIGTHVSPLELKLCDRILSDKDRTVGVRAKPVSNDASSSAIKVVQETLYRRVETAQGSAEEIFQATIQNMTKSSILFTLRFTSIQHLQLFKTNLESGVLAHKFEKTFITDDLKTPNKIKNLGISLAIVDPWEYDMCQKELALLEETERCEQSTEKQTEDEPNIGAQVGERYTKEQLVALWKDYQILERDYSHIEKGYLDLQKENTDLQKENTDLCRRLLHLQQNDIVADKTPSQSDQIMETAKLQLELGDLKRQSDTLATELADIKEKISQMPPLSKNSVDNDFRSWLSSLGQWLHTSSKTSVILDKMMQQENLESTWHLSSEGNEHQNILDCDHVENSEESEFDERKNIIRDFKTGNLSQQLVPLAGRKLRQQREALAAILTDIAAKLQEILSLQDGVVNNRFKTLLSTILIPLVDMSRDEASRG